MLQTERLLLPMPALRHRYLYPSHGIAEVKQGFCWPAFLFGSLWALARRRYALFLLMLAVDLLLWFLTGYAGAQRMLGLALLALGATLAYAFVRGRYGNRWIQHSLLAGGYVRCDPPADP